MSARFAPKPAPKTSASLRPALKGQGYDVYVAGRWHTYFPTWQEACDYCEGKGWTVMG